MGHILLTKPKGWLVMTPHWVGKWEENHVKAGRRGRIQSHRKPHYKQGVPINTVGSHFVSNSECSLLLAHSYLENQGNIRHFFPLSFKFLQFTCFGKILLSFPSSSAAVSYDKSAWISQVLLFPFSCQDNGRIEALPGTSHWEMLGERMDKIIFVKELMADIYNTFYFVFF